jgi:hypothetical protein
MAMVFLRISLQFAASLPKEVKVHIPAPPYDNQMEK